MRYFYVSADIQYPTHGTFVTAIFEIEDDLIVSRVIETIKLQTGITEKRLVKIIFMHETTKKDYLIYNELK